MRCEKHHVETQLVTNDAGSAVIADECPLCRRGVPEYHPVQADEIVRAPNVHSVVAMRAYEVYCHVHSPQETMVTGGCRGGFGAGEIMAFLYARSFPQKEWAARVEEGLRHYHPKR